MLNTPVEQGLRSIAGSFAFLNARYPSVDDLVISLKMVYNIDADRIPQDMKAGETGEQMAIRGK